jgi:stearoyl-CoA desaturase (delta-9 desaturase)
VASPPAPVAPVPTRAGPAPTAPRPREERVDWPRSLPFFAVHALCLAAVFTGVTTTALALCAGLFLGRGVFVTAGYHRYFSHQSYRLNRGWQLVWAFMAEAASQKGILWWASNHRRHHRFADTDQDPHSPRQGFWWSHMRWFLCEKHRATDYGIVQDLARYPELRWIDRHDWIPVWTFGILSFLVGGWSGLVVGFFWSTVLLWHATYLVNSGAHVFGRRRYPTADTSRNSLLIALVAGGEGWHNNHHRYPRSARQGFFWWEVDPTWYFLRACRWLGIVRDLKLPPRHVLEAPGR